MKLKKLISCILVSVFYLHVYSQDIIDPYVDYQGMNFLSSVIYPPTSGYYATNPNNFLYVPHARSQMNCTQYSGEYMILLDEHPWQNGGGSQSMLNSPFNFKSYNIEVVSFPFTVPCWDEPSSCIYPGYGENNKRLFMMPDDIFSSTNNKWNKLYNSYSGSFLLNPNLGYLNSDANMLISRQFLAPGLVAFNDGYLPHTILKHTINFHCTSSPASDIVAKMVFYYDNTRGRMRYYPFQSHNENLPSNNCEHWDVVFIPEILVDPDPSNFDPYIASSNSSWISGGTINYYPFTESNNNNCTSYNPLTNSQYVDYFVPNPLFQAENRAQYYSNIYFPPYSLGSTILKDVHGNTFAGYSRSGNTLTKMPGIKHTYSIDKEFDNNTDGIVDLQMINSIDKIIFNPSEVSIDPNANTPSGTNGPLKVIFPEGYTFKTILGKYPSRQEVLDANNDLQNGGPYGDMRSVPVPVNAADLPHSPNTSASDYPSVMWDDPTTPIINNFYDDERYGYYYIKNKATLTIEQCVNIFDARFSVHEGGTLEFIDIGTNHGNEDKYNDFGRYKIRGEGGAILRNYNQIQYVQNGNIIQTQPLYYKSWDIIEAGDNVDPDADQPTGNYSIMTGADVTFQTEGYIHLTNGFSVQGGDFHALVSNSIPSPIACTPQNRISGNSNSNSNIKKAKAVEYEISCMPNPNNGKWYVDAEKMVSITITNLMGQEILNLENINNNRFEINLEDDQKGIFFIRVVNDAGNVAVEKLIVQ